MPDKDIERELAGVVGDDPSPRFVAELGDRLHEELVVGHDIAGPDTVGDDEDEQLHVVAPDDPGRASSGRWWIRGGLAAAAAAVLVIAVVSTDGGGDDDTVVASGDPDATEAQVTLTWVGPGDLDLVVTEESGEVIARGTTLAGTGRSSTGGVFDTNDYGRCGDSADETHTEQVYWPAGATPSGEIRAWALAKYTCGGPIDYVLEASVQDKIVTTDTGSIAVDTPSAQISFDVR